jgi:RNA recognition motif-containing protein
MKIYVGNLSFEMTEEELHQEFAAFGEVESVVIPTDRYSGRPRGFAFVEMPSVSEGQAAISALNGKVVRDRTLNVDAARPRDDRGGGGSYGGGGRRGGGGGGGGGFGGDRRRRY